MCGDGNHQGFIADTSVTRRTILLSLSAVAAAGGVPMAAFAEDAGARPVTEKDVLVKMADGSADAALFYPKGKGKWPAVLMWPDILGLRPVFREMGKRLAAQGYVVLVPNPYYRAKKAPVVEGAFDFSSKDDMNKLMVFKNGLTDPMVDRDSAAYITYLDAQPQTDKRRKAGVQGYCMSGGFSFQAAAALPDRIGAIGSFHGGNGLATNAPDSPHLLIPKTNPNSTWLVLQAQNDDKQAPQVKEDLKAAFAAAHRKATVEVYPADHGWCVPGGRVYDAVQAERAWAALLQMYRAALV